MTVPAQKFESGTSGREIPKQCETPPPSEGYYWPWCTWENDRSGGSLVVTTHDDGQQGPGVSYRLKHTNGTGFCINHAGEYEFRAENFYNLMVRGAMNEAGNGGRYSSVAGGNSSRSAETVAHNTTGSSGIPPYASAPPRGTIKTSCDVASADVCPGDRAFITAGKCGFASEEFTCKTSGNFTFGGAGTGSITSEGDMTCGSEGGCAQFGGKGVILSSQGGPMSAFSQGPLSLYTQGSNIVISSGGGKVHINGPPPVSTDQAVAASKKPGTPGGKSPKVRARQQTA